MKRVILIVVVVLALLAIGAGTALAIERLAAESTTTMLGWYNPIPQQFCTYPLGSVPSICRKIDSRIVPPDMPVCYWWPGQPIPTQCELGRLTINLTWESYKPN